MLIENIAGVSFHHALNITQKKDKNLLVFYNEI